MFFNQLVVFQKSKINDLLLVFILMLLFLLVQVPTAIYLPSFPAIMNSLHATKAQTQLTVSLYMFVYSISHLFYGPFSDQYGRRVTAIYAGIFFLLGTLICASAFNIYFLYLGRLIQGLSAGAFGTVARAIMQDSFQGKKLYHVNSFLIFIFSITPPLAPALGGYIEIHLGWRAVFFIFSGYVFSTLCALIFLLPETAKQLDSTAMYIKNIYQNYKQILMNFIFIKYALCASLTLGAIIAYEIESPFYFQGLLKLSPFEYGKLFVATGLCIALGSLANMLLLKWFKSTTLIYLGVVILFLTSVNLLMTKLAGITNVSVMLFPIMGFMFGSAFIFANCYPMAISNLNKISGVSGAVYGASQLLGAAIASSLIAPMIGNSQWIIAIALTSISTILTLILHLSNQ